MILPGPDSIRVFRVHLPRDGSHQEIVTKARACGVRWTQVQAAEVLEEAEKKGEDYVPALGYVMAMTENPARILPRVTYRLEACARLMRQEGLGYVPEESREQLERLRDVCAQFARAIDNLLE